MLFRKRRLASAKAFALTLACFDRRPGGTGGLKLPNARATLKHRYKACVKKKDFSIILCIRKICRPLCHLSTNSTGPQLNSPHVTL